MRVRTLLLASVLTLAALVLGLLALLESIDFDSFRGELASDLSERVGREVRIGGRLRVEPGLVPAIEARDVGIANAAGASPPEMAQIGRVRLDLSLWKLLRGTVDIRELELEDVELRLARDAQGRANWPAPTASALAPDDEGDVRFHLVDAKIERVRVEYRDAATDVRRTVQLDKLVLNGRDDGRELSLRSTGRALGAPFELSGRFERDTAAPSAAAWRVALGARVRGAKLEATGTAAPPLSLGAFRLDVRAQAADLASLGEDGGIALPALGPVTAAAELERADGVVAARRIDVEIGDAHRAHASIRGHVEDLARLRGVELTAGFETHGLEHLAPLLGSHPPDVGTLRGSARVSDHDGSLGIEELSLHGGRDPVLRLDLSGRFDDVRNVDGIELRLDLKARDLGVLGALLDEDLPAIGPVALSGRVDGSDERLRIRDLSARLAETRLAGDFDGSFAPGTRPHFRARLRSPLLRLEDVGVAPAPGGGSDAASPTAPAGDGRLFPGDPIALDWLRRADAELALRADRVRGRGGFALDDVRGDLTLRNGDLRLGQLVAAFRGGRLRADGRLDARSAPASAALKARFDGVQFAKVMAQFQSEPELTGTASARLDLASSGSSAREVAASLRGTASFDLRKGSIERKLVDFDVTRSVRRWFLPGHEPRTSAVNCLVADLDIASGVASVRTLVLDTDSVLVLGSGKIDLARERYGLALVPHPKRPELLEAAVPVNIVGPLAAPEVRVSGVSLGKATAAALLANPVYRRAERLLKSMTGRGRKADPCAAIERAR